MARGKRNKLTVSKIGSYHINLGDTELHRFIVRQVKAKGCSSVPEYFRRLAQEAFEAAQVQRQPLRPLVSIASE